MLCKGTGFLNVMLAQRLGSIDLLFAACLKDLMMRKFLPKILCALPRHMGVMVIEGLLLFFTQKDGGSTISVLNVSGGSKLLKFPKSNPRESVFI
jgi:hypothetical protein